MSDDVKSPIDDKQPKDKEDEYDDKTKLDAEDVFVKKLVVEIVDPEEKVIKRGFVEACVDLGDGAEPSAKIVDALEGLRRITIGGLSFAVVAKTTGVGWYAHVLFDGIERFKAISAERDTSTFAALAFEDWPAYALRSDGGRAHVFAGVGDEDEVKTM